MAPVTLTECVDEVVRLRDLLAAHEWQPIDTAPKTRDRSGLSHMIILGFAADEEGYTLPSREGFWNHELGRWVSTLDPAYSQSAHPTHWKPLPDPPAVLVKAEAG